MKSKFTPEKYESWFANFLPNVKQFKLVVFCNNKSKTILGKYANDNIKLIDLPIEAFVTYKHKDLWIRNQLKLSPSLYGGNNISWKVNMLWSEKIFFVDRAIQNKYFPPTEWYGWCDIGYFRGRYSDINSAQLQRWPNSRKLAKLNRSKIHYAFVHSDSTYISKLCRTISRRRADGLSIIKIQPNFPGCIAGGFFLICRDRIKWWRDTYNNKLAVYFKNKWLVKDDQIILVDCICQQLDNFQLHREAGHRYDKWFMFQRILL